MKKMRRVKAIVLGLLFIGSAYACENDVTLKPGETVTYQCGDITFVKARYYQLSDGSLSFVRLSFPRAGQHYTLPQLVSASGARYSDDREISWWIKGDTASIEQRNEKGEWKSMYSTPCKVVEHGQKTPPSDHPHRSY